MRAAKEPPSAEICGEAAALIDVHLRWLDDVRSAEMVATSRVSQLSAMFVASELWTPELQAMRHRVLPAAVGEYLRRFPTARSTGATYVQVIDDDECHIVCLFCRDNLNTVGKGGGQSSRFWQQIYKHTELCAYRMLAGQLEPIGPGGMKGESVLPVSKLKGRALIRAAEQAAEYLGETIPKYRAKRGNRTGLRKGLATELRALVTRARQVAKEREVTP